MINSSPGKFYVINVAKLDLSSPIECEFPSKMIKCGMKLFSPQIDFLAAYLAFAEILTISRSANNSKPPKKRIEYHWHNTIYIVTILAS